MSFWSLLSCIGETFFESLATNDSGVGDCWWWGLESVLGGVRQCSAARRRAEVGTMGGGAWYLAINLWWWLVGTFWAVALWWHRCGQLCGTEGTPFMGWDWGKRKS